MEFFAYDRDKSKYFTVHENNTNKDWTNLQKTLLTELTTAVNLNVFFAAGKLEDIFHFPLKLCP